MGIPGHLVDCAVSAGAGGAFGLVGHLASRTAGYLESRQSFARKQAEWAHETELLRLQAQWRQPETETEPLVADAAPASGERTYRWVGAVRAIVRPLLTLGLAAALAAAFFSMAPSDAARASVGDSLVFAAVTAIVWWFGDRAPARKT